MKNLIILLTLLITLISKSFAQNAASIKQGEVAPFTGVLLTEERADKAMKAEKKVIKLEDLRIAQEELINYHEEQSKTYRRKLVEAKFESFGYVVGAFVIGVLVTGFAAKMNQEINR